jgi:hypothetical protein
MKTETLKFTLDFLNIVFGKGKETDFYWDSVLIPECI